MTEHAEYLFESWTSASDRGTALTCSIGVFNFNHNALLSLKATPGTPGST